MAGAGLDPPPKALNHWRFQTNAKMFEIVTLSVIVLAIGYWVALWLVGRHDDVLHGDFVQPEHGTEPPPLPPFSAPPFPKRPPAMKAAPAPPQPARADNSDTLQALLATIKRDLKDASQL